MVVFETIIGNVKTIIKFKDARNKNKKVSARCRIYLDKTHIEIQSERLWLADSQGQIETSLGLSENSLHRIFELAKEYKIPWWHLMDIKFSLQNISRTKFKYVYRGPASSKDLRFIVAGKTGPIKVSFEKIKGKVRGFDKTHSSLKDIASWIEGHLDETSTETNQ